MDQILKETLVTGGTGMVGSYVDFGTKVSSRDCDITDLGQVLGVVSKYKPAVILHLAAETDLSKCEKEPARAYLVNSIGTYNIATAAKGVGARMVYISTDDVFSQADKPHSETEEPAPTKIYGSSKYLGELAVRGILNDYLIVRTAWVFGGGKEKDKKFVAKIVEQLDQDKISVVSDQPGSPTFAKDLVETVKKLITNKERGIVHATNKGVCSRHDVAIEIAKFFDSNAEIVAVGSETFNLPGHSRSSGGLISTRVELRSWQEALKEYLSTEWKK